MNHSVGLGLYISSARFVPTNVLFNHSDITKERTVECHELVLFLRDGGYSVINHTKYPITAGSIRFLRPGDKVHSYRFNEIYVIHFTADNKKSGTSFLEDFPHFIKLPDTTEEIRLIKKIIVAMASKHDLDCVCALCELLERIKLQCESKQQNSEKHVVGQIKKHIREHFSEKITLESIAVQFHLHPVYLHKKFKKEAGMTPYEYQKQTKLAKAKAYLLTTDLSIDEISELCGFCNTSYFIDIFKKSENITPFKFKQQNNLSEIH